MPLTTFAELGQLVYVARHSKIVRDFLQITNESELRSLSDFRNRVAHVVKPIIAGPKHISSVANQVETMLAWIKSWDELVTADFTA
jgi:hypothetical protein